MSEFLKRFGLAFLAAAAVTQAASAQETQRQYEVDLGVGVSLAPKYETAESYLLSPFPLISVGRFYVPGLGQVVDGKRKTGVFFYPSFGFIGERKPSDSADLTGTRKVNWALELGLGGGYRAENWRVFAELRQGINGHHGQVGRLGADAIIFPMDRVEVSFGPRADFVSGSYMDTYFGVTAAEAAASGGRLSAYNPDGGFKSVGLETRISYDWTDDVRVHLQGGYDRLIGDAAKSPLAKNGSKDQFTVGLGVTYKFRFDLF
ncbi:MipA/OmpV family protein [Labrenzia suaedae]|uniref:MipA/OmpV family protein n=2 Tax=Roseibium litorale TaxID=2803841 RepID=A0ABR9CP76_9HYPH|nr:MipA/OmpV family protein [Roseibium litorale]